MHTDINLNFKTLIGIFESIHDIEYSIGHERSGDVGHYRLKTM